MNKILIVDSENKVLEIYKEYLKNYSITTSQSVFQSIKELSNLEYNILISDISFNDGNVFDVMTYINNEGLKINNLVHSNNFLKENNFDYNNYFKFFKCYKDLVNKEYLKIFIDTYNGGYFL